MANLKPVAEAAFDMSRGALGHARGMVQQVGTSRAVAPLAAFATTAGSIANVGTILGFGAQGVAAGSYAAAFQGAVYGGLTPAGGIFASMTSAGMLGTLPWFAAGAALPAGGVAAVAAWKIVKALT